jgi:excisionase family DNA binding protein
MSASSNSNPLLHSINDTKSLLNCGRNTVYNLVHRNELTMIKMGRRSLITDESIREYIDRKVAEAQSRTYRPNGVSTHNEQVSR